ATGAGMWPADWSTAAHAWTSSGTPPRWVCSYVWKNSTAPVSRRRNSTRRFGKPATAANAAPPTTYSATARTSTPLSTTPPPPPPPTNTHPDPRHDLLAAWLRERGAQRGAPD